MRNVLFIIISLPLILLIVKFALFPDKIASEKSFPTPTKSVTISKTPEHMKITSAVFANQKPIPAKYTCKENGINPPLEFTDIPKDAKSLALIMDDPDAPIGTFVHWVVYNIASNSAGIAEDSKPEGTEGVNGIGKLGYIGPCPPSGTHRYFFKLYALDAQLKIQETPDKAALEKAMDGHIIEQTELIGLFSK